MTFSTFSSCFVQPDKIIPMDKKNMDTKDDTFLTDIIFSSF